MEVAQRIDELWESGELDAEPIEEALALLDSGEVRVAEHRDGAWVERVDEEGDFLYFRLRKAEPLDIGGLHFLDKIPVKNDYAEHGFVSYRRAWRGTAPSSRARDPHAGVRQHRGLVWTADDGGHLATRARAPRSALTSIFPAASA